MHHLSCDLDLPEAAPLPPPPVPRRLARGSGLVPVDVHVREIEPPEGWSRVVPLSVRGRPLLARDRRPAVDRARLDRATAIVGALAVALGALATMLLI